MDEDKNERFCLVRGGSGFVRVWPEDIACVFESELLFTVMHSSLPYDEAYALACIANANIEERITE